MASPAVQRSLPAFAPLRRTRLFPGWWIVGAGVCIEALVHALFMQAFGAYVDRAVSRAVIDRHRSESRRQKREQVYAHRQPAAQPDAHLGVDDRSLLYPALESLSGDQRLTVVLRYWADLSDQGIAAAMNCSVGTVKSRLSRSLRIIEGVLHEPVDHA